MRGDWSVDFGRTSEHPDVTLRATQGKVYGSGREKFEGEVTENIALAGSRSKMINRWVGEHAGSWGGEAIGEGSKKETGIQEVMKTWDGTGVSRLCRLHGSSCSGVLTCEPTVQKQVSCSKNTPLFLFFFFPGGVCVCKPMLGRGSTPMFRAHSWLSTQQSPLAVLREPYGMVGREPGSVSCKPNALPIVLALQPKRTLRSHCNILKWGRDTPTSYLLLFPGAGELPPRFLGFCRSCPGPLLTLITELWARFAFPAAAGWLRAIQPQEAPHPQGTVKRTVPQAARNRLCFPI